MRVLILLHPAFRARFIVFRVIFLIDNHRPVSCHVTGQRRPLTRFIILSQTLTNLHNLM